MILILEKINSPADLKPLDYDELKQLSGELREKIISVCSKHGGHLASNLGIIETTVAIHRVFNAPEDKIIFDVGHQCYAHKLLTGRLARFDTLRQEGGLSGFPNRFESEYDPMCEGHCGTSISAALGIAEANSHIGSDAYTVAVAGDGAFTNGMIYEALNNCSGKKLRLIIVLNDNGMSISTSVGGLPRYFGKLRSSKGYLVIKNSTRSFLEHIPYIGAPIARGVRRFKNFIKKLVLKPVLFDDFGVTYLGPVDGNDVKSIETILNEARRRDEICIVHILTQKGRGYPKAEKDPTAYHSTGTFNRKLGVESSTDSTSFSSVFGEEMCLLASEDDRICAITAAMTDGTGLGNFAKEFPGRFFDVGIAEEHAITFAGGLCAGGMKPVCAIYSTFIQRCYDQLIHDISLQKLNVILAIDRSGFVSGDGVTHQGTLDVAMLSSIPGTTIYSPETYSELREALREAFLQSGITAIRFPKGSERCYDRGGFIDCGGFTVYGEEGEADAVIVTYGRVTSNAVAAAQALSGKRIRIIKLKKIFPINAAELIPHFMGARLIYVLEEGCRHGGIGEKIGAMISSCDELHGVSFFLHALDDYVPHATVSELEKLTGFDADSLSNELKSLI